MDVDLEVEGVPELAGAVTGSRQAVTFLSKCIRVGYLFSFFTSLPALRLTLLINDYLESRRAQKASPYQGVSKASLPEPETVTGFPKIPGNLHVCPGPTRPVGYQVEAKREEERASMRARQRKLAQNAIFSSLRSFGK
ncbi:hypothetical protein FA13DRAFT_1004458 [Coprinellus micaceus]|uniref:Uncharacterized protein n=1 Tax=Coprinellus micaceus TaxID=71717 RepID=A0A4Y7RQ97_COPMI|nr:hypothetical protein FA13DRAFT_1004458 [Coprinellus micaceus]